MNYSSTFLQVQDMVCEIERRSLDEAYQRGNGREWMRLYRAASNYAVLRDERVDAESDMYMARERGES